MAPRVEASLQVQQQAKKKKKKNQCKKRQVWMAARIAQYQAYRQQEWQGQEANVKQHTCASNKHSKAFNFVMAQLCFGGFSCAGATSQFAVVFDIHFQFYSSR